MTLPTTTTFFVGSRITKFLIKPVVKTWVVERYGTQKARVGLVSAGVHGRMSRFGVTSVWVAASFCGLKWFANAEKVATEKD